MKIVILGGGGFIGSSVLVNLPSEHKIVSLDHGRKYEQVRKLIKNNVKLVKGDITNSNLIDKLVKDANVVMNFAGGGGNVACMKDPVNAVKTHIFGTDLLVEKSLKYDIDHLIYASSISAYTTFKDYKILLTEDTPLRPDDFYGTLKTAAENKISNSGINYTILRFSNVYGYGSSILSSQMDGATGKFITAAHCGSDITIYGEGKQCIDYVHINDVVRCLKIILNNPLARNEIFNVGSGKLYSIYDLAKIISDIGEKIYKHKSNIKKIQSPEGKIWPDRKISIEKIKNKLQWSPHVSLEEGLTELMEKFSLVVK